ncbi:MAG: tetratricopeptide repeat protein, partial [Pyrinomonadaceae bacterium]
MRNAERFVAQGKIRAAIAEYRTVVDNDPRDIATLNMLGDLHAKNSEKKEAVKCYMQVAEHYNKQGFAQKAIAIYNKISRIQPDSIEVSAKLAELHKGKGSLSEARSHYTTLAEHYQKTGKRLEALAMYKQIALLDPNNTEVCINLADSYIREGQRDE